MALEPLMNSLKRLRESDLGPESYSEWHLIIVIKKRGRKTFRNDRLMTTEREGEKWPSRKKKRKEKEKRE